MVEQQNLESEFLTLIDNPKYEMSITGVLRNAKTKRILTPYVTHNNIITYDTMKCGKKIKISAAREVYQLFHIKGKLPLGYSVFFKDYNPSNFAIGNLYSRKVEREIADNGALITKGLDKDYSINRATFNERKILRPNML